MLILPKPASGELAHGYWGRLSHLNLFASPPKAMRALVHEFGIGKHVSQQAFALAKAAGLPPAEFISSHTLLPYLLAAEPQTPEESRGYKRGGRRGTQISALSLPRDFAYLCPECHEAQRHQTGHTYWVREHQLPGIFWCSVHGSLLQAVDTQKVYETPPPTGNKNAWIPSGATNVEQKALKRFADISVGFLNCSRKEDYLRAYMRLSYHQTSRSQSFVSDLVIKQFPAWWLERVLPNPHSKVAGQPYPPIDGYLQHRNPAAFALALSVLFGSAEEALGAWFG